MTVLFANGEQMHFPTATKAVISEKTAVGTPIIFSDASGNFVAVFRFELLVGYWQDVEGHPPTQMTPLAARLDRSIHHENGKRATPKPKKGGDSE